MILKKWGARVALTILCVCLVATMGLSMWQGGRTRQAAADGQQPGAATPTSADPTTATASGRQEVVYANLNADGSLDAAYVVNKLTLDGSATPVMDYGNYSAVENLTDLSPLTQTADGVEVQSSAKELYYQGDLTQATLPWNIQVSYQLNGQPISADQLGGAAGALAIEVKTSRSSYANAVFYKNYVLQIQITLDSSKCTNIQAPDAQAAVAGTNTVSSFTVLPGKDSDNTVTANVTDFSMPAISIAAVPFNMAFDVDTSSLTGDFGQLSSAVSKLNGSGGKLASASTQIKAALDKVDQSLSKADIGSATSGFDLSQFAKLPGALTAISKALTTQIAANLPDAQTADQLAQLIGSPYCNIDQLAGQPGTAAQIAALIKALPTMKAGIQTAAASLDTMAASIKSGLASAKAAIGKSTAALKAEFGTLQKGLHTIATNYATFDQGIQAYTGGVSTLNENTAGLPDKVQKEIDKFMASYKSKDFKMTSFVSARNRNTTACQFVLQTAAIKAPDTSAAAAGDDTSQPQTFWDRLLALF